MADKPRTHLQSWGTPGQPAVLFLHGFMGAASDWAAIASPLSASYYCLALDLPGHGANATAPAARGFTMAQCLESIREALESQGLESCTLVGYSMGGRAALHAALALPKRIRRLILESASPGIADPVGRARRRASDEALAAILDPLRPNSPEFRAFLERWYAAPLFTSLRRRPELLEAIMPQRLQNRPAALAASLRGMGAGAQENLWPRLIALEAPVTLLVGEADEKYQRIARAMDRALPESTLQEIPAAGHNVHLESPDRYTEILRAALSS